MIDYFKKIGLSVKEIKRGEVCGLANNDPPRETASFQAQIIILDHKGIRKGYSPVILCHTATVSCRFDALLAKMDRRTGKLLEENPEVLRKGDSALVNLVPNKPLCVEEFSKVGV